MPSTECSQLLVFLLRFCILLHLVLPSVCEDGISSSEILNTCIDSKHHRTVPGPEADLYKQCIPWKNRSCCTSNTTKQLHGPLGPVSMYNFRLNHCPDKQDRLSDECNRHFMQDSCFYECEPNLGPWKVKVKRKFANERFFRVPLCASDCESWFNACKRDFTCVANWPRAMNFSGGGGNRCPTGAECRTFQEVYNDNSSYFCSQVWDESFQVVSDRELCLRIWFDGSQGNPNDRAAKEYVKFRMQTDSATVPFASNLLALTLISFILSGVSQHL